MGSKRKAWMLIPCFVPCYMGQTIQIARDHQAAWLHLVQTQAKLYRPLGVHVTLAKELRTCGVGSDRDFTNSTVGLRFEVGPMQTFALQQPMSQTDVVAKLEKLNELHQTGAIN